MLICELDSFCARIFGKKSHQEHPCLQVVPDSSFSTAQKTFCTPPARSASPKSGDSADPLPHRLRAYRQTGATDFYQSHFRLF